MRPGILEASTAHSATRFKRREKQARLAARKTLTLCNGMYERQAADGTVTTGKSPSGKPRGDVYITSSEAERP